MVGREFPGEQWDRLPPATRRQFLKVMGASLAFSGLTACRWPAEEIVPFAHRPEGRTPGATQSFATSFERFGAAVGALATSCDGRPIKLEGNPGHPDSLGGASAQLQAAVLELYDPDRSRRIELREGGQEYVKSWEDFSAFAVANVAGAASENGGAGVAVLAEASASPTLQRMRGRLLERLPRAKWYEYEPLSLDNEREGLRLLYGRPLRPQLRLGRAAVLACFEADPLMDHPSSLAAARHLAAARQPDAPVNNRLYAAETTYTLTGAMADHRVAVPLSQVPVVLAQVALRLLDEHGVRLPEGTAALVGAVRGAAGAEIDTELVSNMASDLAHHRGAGLIVVGPRLQPQVHALAHLLNRGLDNVGSTVELTEDPEPDRVSHVEALTELCARMRAGEIGTLLILGGNPVYDAPADLEFSKCLEAVETSIHLGLYADETSHRCRWHLPRAHTLEEWGDGRAWDGTLTLRQPLIEPLYGGRSPVEVLATMLGDEPVKGYDIVRETLQDLLQDTDFERSWRRALHDGLVSGSAWTAVEPSVEVADPAGVASALAEALSEMPPSADRLELVFVADSKVADGRFANNAWLQELPDAITKITWDNALTMGATTAHRLGLGDGDVVSVEVAGASLELPLYVTPGQAAFTAAVALGYGRTAAGQVGTGVGANAYVLRRSGALHSVADASIKRTGRTYRLATTQDDHAIDMIGFEARNIRVGTLVREATQREYHDDPRVIEHQGHHPPLISLWKEHVYEGEQWGMAIDLNTCIGCNACVVACQAENNVPVVGREQVINQREMHWIRLDRYFRTEPGLRPEEVDRADMVFQPVACVHCESAPCEQVCPVAATQHTSDGLNAMAYNRCVGTRYCSNNCPFKVRRFNFFNYHKELDELSAMQHNPEVTVRSRRVMEKCTYCVQRIQKARIVARNDRRPIADGEIVPACAQTCPTRAITFGNLNDPSSAIAELREDHRGYAMLAELNIKPRTQYLARLRNPAGGEAASRSAPDHGDHHGKESA